MAQNAAMREILPRDHASDRFSICRCSVPHPDTTSFRACSQGTIKHAQPPIVPKTYVAIWQAEAKLHTPSSPPSPIRPDTLHRSLPHKCTRLFHFYDLRGMSLRICRWTACVKYCARVRQLVLPSDKIWPSRRAAERFERTYRWDAGQVRCTNSIRILLAFLPSILQCTYRRNTTCGMRNIVTTKFQHGKHVGRMMCAHRKQPCPDGLPSLHMP